MDALNRRLEILASTAPVALPTLIAVTARIDMNRPDYLCGYFLGGVLLLLLSTCVSLWARRCGELNSLSLKRVLDTTRGRDFVTFAETVLVTANRDICHNRKLNTKKGRAAAIAAIELLAGIILLVLWLVVPSL